MTFNHTAKLSCFWLVLVCFLYLSPVNRAFATHIRAGDITAQSDTSAQPDLLRVHFKLEIYVVGNAGIDDLTGTMFFGDGTQQTSPKASDVPVGNNTNRRIYYFDHVYPAGGTYTVTYAEQNRNPSIVNFQDPGNTNFLLQTTITISPQIGINHTPRFTVPPIDLAAQGQIFVHFPGAYDLDKDSIAYVLRTPLQNTGTPQNPIPAPVFAYKSPDDVKFNGKTVADGSTQPNQNAIFRLNPITGEIRWNTPGQPGDYNIAFVVEEWKVIPGRKPIKLGEVMRDMQITVKPATVNLPPILTLPKDTCVVAGSMIRDTISAIDGDLPPNPKDKLDPPNKPIQAFGGVFEIKPPAVFVSGQTNPNPDLPTKGLFTWTPTCNDISDRPYEVIFKATDKPEVPQPALTALKMWRITVVGPPPTNLVATSIPNRQIKLNWDNYTVSGCANAEKIMIYRKENLANFIPGPCETGVPEFTGYKKIAEVPGNATTYTDTNNGLGLKMGANFCYIIYAQFPLPKGGKSLASNESCAEVPILTSVMTNVSVLETNTTTGRIFVSWTQPVGDLINFTGPYQYRLYRSGALPGVITPPVFKQIYTTANVTTDTTFTDTGRNTQDSVFTYKIEFYYTASPNPGMPPMLTLLEEGQTAGSVRLNAVSSGQTMKLNWTYTVPWDNSTRKHLIYRKINNVFTLIDSVQAGPLSGAYTDKGTFGNQQLEVGKTYCYYVETVGDYLYSKLKLKVRNNSQEFCQLVRDTTAPCPPVLLLALLNCDSLEQTPFKPPFSNKLNWVTASAPDCGKDIKEFSVYFRPTETGDFTKIATTTDSAYVHSNLLTSAGCYVVTAVDSSGNESAYSNVVCQDICYFFDLPNIFTPNNDGFNDLFVPRQSAFVKAIKFEVYNRWGQKIYESANDPNINWPGTNSKGNRVADGLYYYHAEVEFNGLNPTTTRKLFKGWVQIVR